MTHEESKKYDLIRHFKRFVELTSEEESEIVNYFQLKEFSKKENLMELNSRCRYHFFVLKGCLRMFFIGEKGVEQTIQFAIENWWITDYAAFERQGITEFAIQAVEPTCVMQIDFKNQMLLLEDFPKLERYYRMIYQRLMLLCKCEQNIYMIFQKRNFIIILIITFLNLQDGFPSIC
ncbi:Crp/Fnr family transcriptional regulator [Sphingobacterium sp. T2]|uniref:Crp/Fnr family transcriptional regulator n=1 Tax=Sphingobacterium sp. T2 TaxID=1590596 RepID=UPI000B2BD98F|nr:Crp/Fnr family transcriptional regulator [Sphingobacterium sp. T2]